MSFEIVFFLLRTVDFSGFSSFMPEKQGHNPIFFYSYFFKGNGWILVAFAKS